MSKKLEYTPHSQVKNALRRLWLRSRERSAIIKKLQNTCEECGTKGSVAKGRVCKIEVHHKRIINWEKIFKVIYKELLVSVRYLKCLCKECHKEITEEQRKEVK